MTLKASKTLSHKIPLQLVRSHAMTVHDNLSLQAPMTCTVRSHAPKPRRRRSMKTTPASVPCLSIHSTQSITWHGAIRLDAHLYLVQSLCECGLSWTTRSVESRNTQMMLTCITDEPQMPRVSDSAVYCSLWKAHAQST
jgi:hypothetical protein